MSREPKGLSSVQQWMERLDRFGYSGQTVAEFCQAEGVSQSSFYDWKKKLVGGNRGRGGRTSRGRKSKSVFKPVQVTPTIGLQQNTTIRLADGVEIELGNNLQVVDLVIQSVVKQVLQNQQTRAGGSPC